MEIILLASGSTGNCTLVRAGRGSDQVVVALDCGIAQRTARRLATDCGLSLTSVDAVLLSHAHSDHSANVVAVAARAGAPLYAHSEVPDQRRHMGAAERNRRKVEHIPFLDGAAFEIGPLRITPVELPHDSDPTHGFLFEADGQKAGYFTDLGRPDILMGGLLEGLESLVLEFNYDAQMLQQGPYPVQLKERIAGGLGHLSNQESGQILQTAMPKELKQLTLAHLSKHNNRPKLAMEAACSALAAAGRSDLLPKAAPPQGVVRAGPDAPTRDRLPLT
jgi:phosphoribosyl 1,2-cyclic phosphodiesterase